MRRQTKDILTNSVSNVTDTNRAPYASHTASGSDFVFRVPFPLIKRFVEGQRLNRQRELAIFIKLKITFRNSVIYNYTSTNIPEIAKKVGISTSCLRKYIKIFFKEEWLFAQGNHLRLKEIIEISKIEGCGTNQKNYNHIWKNKKTEKLIIKKKYGIKDILCEIRFQVILKKKKSFDFLDKVFRDCNKTKSQGEKGFSNIKKSLKLKNKYRLDDKNFTMKNGYLSSLKTIARNIGRMSQSTASRLMKLSEKNNRVKIEFGEFKYLKNASHVLEEEMPQNTFFWKGFLCKRECNKYVFL